MGFFRKRQDQRPSGYTLPYDIVDRMARFGRYEINPEGSGERGDEQGQLMGALYPLASAEPERFVADLAAAVTPVGGWAVYGASRTVWELINSPNKQHPGYKAIMDGTIGFLRSNGIPPMRVRGYEWQYWLDSGGTRDAWLPRRPTPSEIEAPITELRPGEVRRIEQLTSQPDSNVILVRRREDGQYCTVIDETKIDDDSRRVQNEGMVAPSLYELYSQFALVLQTPPFWCDRELEPYFPLPQPRI